MGQPRSPGRGGSCHRHWQDDRRRGRRAGAAPGSGPGPCARAHQGAPEAVGWRAFGVAACRNPDRPARRRCHRLADHPRRGRGHREHAAVGRCPAHPTEGPARRRRMPPVRVGIQPAGARPTVRSASGAQRHLRPRRRRPPRVARPVLRRQLLPTWLSARHRRRGRRSRRSGVGRRALRRVRAESVRRGHRGDRGRIETAHRAVRRGTRALRRVHARGQCLGRQCPTRRTGQTRPPVPAGRHGAAATPRRSHRQAGRVG